MIVEHPKVLYNEKNVTVTVRSPQEEAILAPFFNSGWDHLKPTTEISYLEAVRCLEDAKKETAQEKNVRRETENNDKKLVEGLKLQEEKDSEKSERREEARKAFMPVLKKLDSYGWSELKSLGKEINKKLGVKLPLGAKRDVIEQAITEVLENGNDSK